jgi:hypothetical protein
VIDIAEFERRFNEAYGDEAKMDALVKWLVDTQGEDEFVAQEMVNVYALNRAGKTDVVL